LCLHRTQIRGPAGYDAKTTRCGKWRAARTHPVSDNQGVPLGLAYSPLDRLLATGGSDFIAYVWDITGQRTVDRKIGEFTREMRDVLWADLADADARKAYTALQTLMANREQPLDC